MGGDTSSVSAIPLPQWASIMTKIPDDPALVGKISAGYSASLALDLLEAFAQPFKRVIEDVRIDHGECRRQLTIDWLLPKLADALPDHDLVKDQAFLGKFAELSPNLVVPVLSLRREFMMTDFSVRGPSGEQFYICGQDESIRHAQRLLRTLWQWVDDAATQSPNVKREILDKAREDYLRLPSMPSGAARDTASAMAKLLAAADVALDPELLKRVLLFGRYMARYHIIWAHLPHQPGDGVRLTLSYRTRFAADYPPVRDDVKGLGRFRLKRRIVNGVRRTLGQEPARFAVPVWMSASCRSYHFQMSAPPAMYVVSQGFVLARNLHQRDDEQQAAFSDYYKVNGAYVGENDESGGPVAHLYARDLPATADNQLYACVGVRERPPGSTALVMWLALLAAGFLWFYNAIWESLTSSDTSGIDHASLSVALLGTASAWFLHAFRGEAKPRFPLVSRVGLVFVGASTLYSLLAILVHRVTCSADSEPVCSSAMSVAFSQTGLQVVAVLVSGVVCLLFWRWITFHREYRRLQMSSIERYTH
jgi:hypothetical protein